MTRDEFYKKYGDVKVKFADYYKYTFTYSALLSDGRTLHCDYGGQADDIYRHNVNTYHKESIETLQPYAGRVSKDGQIVEDFYDF